MTMDRFWNLYRDQVFTLVYSVKLEFKAQYPFAQGSIMVVHCRYHLSSLSGDRGLNGPYGQG